MHWQRAKALQAGDEVAVVLPSSAVRDAAAFERGLDRLRGWGLHPTVLCEGRPNEGLDWPDGGAVAADDAARKNALQQALREPRFRAIFCGRGGYGAARLLGDLDWAPLREDPKPIVGYSDISALLSGAAREAGVVGLHGPMVATTTAMDPGDDGWELQRRLLTEADLPTALPAAGGARALCSGVAEGALVGGNLAVLQGLLGTPWAPPTDGALLFLEDIGEAPYRVDRMLTQLRQCGVLERVAGVLLGDFHVEGTALASEHPGMRRVLEERLGDLNVPVACGLPFGHRPGAWTLPFGAQARLVAEPGAVEVCLLEPCVR